MGVTYDIGLATPEDIPAMLALQEPNLYENGGGLSVRQSSEWFRNTMSEMPIVAGWRDGKLVGYVLATTLAAKSHVAIVQAMLQRFPPAPDCYMYGPVCVAETERGKGLAGAMFKELQTYMPSRSAMTFVRADNEKSRRAHDKMGMRELGPFMSDGQSYIALSYDG